MSADREIKNNELLSLVPLLLQEYKPFYFYQRLIDIIASMDIYVLISYEKILDKVEPVVEHYVGNKLASLNKKLKDSFDLKDLLPDVREIFDIIRIQFKYCVPNQRLAVAKEREDLKAALISLLQIKHLESNLREELENCLLYPLKTFDFSILTSSEHNQRLIDDKKAQEEEEHRKKEQDKKRLAVMQKSMHEVMSMFLDRGAFKQRVQKTIAGVSENKEDTLERLIAENQKWQYFTPQEFEKIVVAARDTPFEESILPMGNQSSNGSSDKKIVPHLKLAAVQEDGEKPFDPDSPVNSPDNPSLT